MRKVAYAKKRLSSIMSGLGQEMYYFSFLFNVGEWESHGDGFNCKGGQAGMSAGPITRCPCSRRACYIYSFDLHMRFVKGVSNAKLSCRHFFAAICRTHHLLYGGFSEGD